MRQSLTKNSAYKDSHDCYEIMTRINSSSHDNHDQLSGNLVASRNIHEFAQKNSTTAGIPVSKGQAPRDTLVPSRRLISLVNNDPTFIEAQRYLGLYPQKLYTLVRDGGVARVKQVTDFILSLALETPYFQVDQDGQYDPSPEGMRDRARKMLINMALTDKPILDKYAGPSYFKRWPRETV